MLPYWMRSFYHWHPSIKGLLWLQQTFLSHTVIICLGLGHLPLTMTRPKIRSCTAYQQHWCYIHKINKSITYNTRLVTRLAPHEQTEGTNPLLTILDIQPSTTCVTLSCTTITIDAVMRQMFSKRLILSSLLPEEVL